MYWQTARHQINLDKPCVMGIVNVTPDSFSEPGRHASTPSAIATSAISVCEQLLKEGAHVLDIGAQSSRPGATAISSVQEIARLQPVLKAALSMGVPISVDTFAPEVMRMALDLGADIINDIYALRVPGALQLIAQHPSCGVCLMHMQGEPQSMQQQPHYTDVVQEVMLFLQERLRTVCATGVQARRIVLDPGIGFGKTPEHNMALLARQTQLLQLAQPLLVGWSRKSTLGVITERPASERLAASVAAALASVVRGAKVLRVHDVAATIDALKVWQAAGLSTSITLKPEVTKSRPSVSSGQFCVSPSADQIDPV
jgi:dihydropteroate synthase